MVVKARFILFIAVVILLSFCMLLSTDKTLFDSLNITNLTVYTSDNISEFETKLSGNGFSFVCDIETYEKLTCDIDGISFETELLPEQIFDRINLRIQSKQRILQENGVLEIYYCYLENLGGGVTVANKKVNIQIAFNGEKTILGIPLILGSY